MDDASPRSRPPSVIFLGTTGRLSAPPLRALLDAGVEVRAVVLPALATGTSAPPIAPLSLSITNSAPAASISSRPRVALPMAGAVTEQNVVTLAKQHKLPLFEVARLADPRALATLGSFSPGLVCVACFPLRLPPVLLALPRLGCINLHPSLLPDNRGPDPLFWTFQRGQHETGVTIHRMDASLDTGPILAHERVALPERIDEATLERDLAECGARLMARVVEGFHTGSIVEQPQDETIATRFSWPTLADYEIEPDWSARRAYIFACGIRGREQQPVVRLAGRLFAVVEPLGYDASGILGVPWQLDDDMLRLQCSPGVFRARVTLISEAAL